mmetsp:Transcript_22317/g.33011  ORF Transcript_22317/g.33011 Transcript_22317/m.33011 type:complete len:148 (-) Transcript_22317:192-635(-)
MYRSIGTRRTSHMHLTVDTTDLDCSSYIQPTCSSRQHVSTPRSKDAHLRVPASPPRTLISTNARILPPFTPIENLPAQNSLSPPPPPPPKKRKFIMLDHIQDWDLDLLQSPLIQVFDLEDMDIGGEKPENRRRKWRLLPLPNPRNNV